MKNVVKNKKTKMTIDKLARITANGFSEIKKRFNKVEGRMDKVEGRLGRVETAVTDLKITMDRRLNSIEEKIEYGIDKMQTMADGMTKQFLIWKEENAIGAGVEARQDDKLNNHEKRIVELEKV